jgi:hypothetical protein
MEAENGLSIAALPLGETDVETCEPAVAAVERPAVKPDRIAATLVFVLEFPEAEAAPNAVVELGRPRCSQAQALALSYVIDLGLAQLVVRGPLTPLGQGSSFRRWSDDTWCQNAVRRRRLSSDGAQLRGASHAGAYFLLRPGI